MKLVKILCGGYGLPRPHGGKRLILAGQTVALNDTEAERLIALGHAAPVATEECADFVAEQGANTSAQKASKEPLIGSLDPEQLATMTKANLKKLAEDMGLDTSGCNVKADYVALISAEGFPVDDDEGEDAVDDGDAPPDLGAEAPVV